MFQQYLLGPTTHIKTEFDLTKTWTTAYPKSTKSWQEFIIELLGQKDWVKTKKDKSIITNLALYQTENTEEKKKQFAKTIAHLIMVFHSICLQAETTSTTSESRIPIGAGAGAGAGAATDTSITEEPAENITNARAALTKILQRTAFIPKPSTIREFTNRVEIDHTSAIIMIDALAMWYETYDTFFPGDDEKSRIFRSLLHRTDLNLDERNDFINYILSLKCFESQPTTPEEALFKARLFEAFILTSIPTIISTKEKGESIKDAIEEAKYALSMFNHSFSGMDTTALSTFTSWLSSYDPNQEDLQAYLRRKALETTTPESAPDIRTATANTLIPYFIEEAKKPRPLTPETQIPETPLTIMSSLFTSTSAERATATDTSMTTNDATARCLNFSAISTGTGAAPTIDTSAANDALHSLRREASGIIARHPPNADADTSIATHITASTALEDAHRTTIMREKLKTELEAIQMPSSPEDTAKTHKYIQLARVLPANALPILRRLLPPKEIGLFEKAILLYAHNNFLKRKILSLTDASIDRTSLLPKSHTSNPLLEEFYIYIINAHNLLQYITHDARLTRLIQELTFDLTTTHPIEKINRLNQLSLVLLQLFFPSSLEISEAQRLAIYRLLSFSFGENLDDPNTFSIPGVAAATLEEAWNTTAAYLANPKLIKIYQELILSILTANISDTDTKTYYGMNLPTLEEIKSAFSAILLEKFPRLTPSIWTGGMISPTAKLSIIKKSFYEAQAIEGERTFLLLKRQRPRIPTYLFPTYQLAKTWAKIISGEIPRPATFQALAELLTRSINSSFPPEDREDVAIACVNLLSLHPEVLVQLADSSTPISASTDHPMTPVRRPRARVILAAPTQASARERIDGARILTFTQLQIWQHDRFRRVPACSWKNISYKTSPWLALSLILAAFGIYSARLVTSPSGDTPTDNALDSLAYIAAGVLGAVVAAKIFLSERGNAFFPGTAKMLEDAIISKYEGAITPKPQGQLAPYKYYLYSLNASLWLASFIFAALTLTWKALLTIAEAGIPTNVHPSGDSDDDATPTQINTINRDIILGLFSLLTCLFSGVAAITTSWLTRRFLRSIPPVSIIEPQIGSTAATQTPHTPTTPLLGDITGTPGGLIRAPDLLSSPLGASGLALVTPKAGGSTAVFLDAATAPRTDTALGDTTAAAGTGLKGGV